VLRDPATRAVWQAILSGWAAEGLLVRFAIRLGTQRVALVAGLRAGTRLIYHNVAMSPLAEKHRAGHVLIRLIGLWMAERGFDTLDFGAGGEEYKSRYANGDDPLWRVFGARSALSQIYLRGLAEHSIRSSERMMRAWDSFTLYRHLIQRWISERGKPVVTPPA
jgi:CelD/BcsL family acetyltransferase involved in cellulose biosynthesis